ncbi:MAG: putative glutamine transport system substrate-binding protein [Vicingaceae bacterium]|jgi:putative glutamine transport system substrate-binding protein
MNYNKLKFALSIVLILFGTVLSAQSFEEAIANKKSEINVYYFDNEPYAYKNDKGVLVGIEVDIMKSFVNWLKDEKGIELKLNFMPFNEFNNFYNEMRAAKTNTIGLGSVTITDARAKEVKFSAPYLKNVSVLITDGSVPTARNDEDLKNDVLSLTPVTIKGSIHQTHLDELYKNEDMNRDYVYVSDAIEIPMKIRESAKYYGYVDVISFWKYLKSNTDHYVKMHAIANKTEEVFGFVMPNLTDWDGAINEFFESGFGFTSTKEYHSILEKHLSFEIIDKVELD